MSHSFSLGIVSQDSEIVTELDKFFSRAGFGVRAFAQFFQLEEELARVAPDAIVLDTQRRRPACATAARVRARSPVGIVLLADDPAEDDRQLSLSMGIDYYLPKPVNLAELESMVRNLSRRSAFDSVRSSHDAEPPAAARSDEAWSLRTEGWQLIAPNGGVTKLSATEFAAMQILFQAPSRTKSREMIASELGRNIRGESDRSLDVLMSRIRRKVEESAGLELPVRAVRGRGYVFSGNVKGGEVENS